MSDKEITDLDTVLTTLVEKINVFTPQCPAHFRSDEKKLRFLRNAVIREEWAACYQSDNHCAVYLQCPCDGASRTAAAVQREEGTFHDFPFAV